MSPAESTEAPQEICGEKSATEKWPTVSDSGTVRISFTTTDKTIGAQVNILELD